MAIRNSFTALIICLSFSTIWSQESVFLTTSLTDNLLIDKGITPTDAHVFDISLSSLIEKLKDAPDYRNEKESTGIELKLILPDATTTIVQLHEAPVSHIDHYNKYPENKTYKITGADNKFISGRLAISPRGVRGLLYTENQTVFVESLDGDQHVSYIYKNVADITCDTDMRESLDVDKSSARSSAAFGDEILEFRIAIASSGEWSNERNNDLTVINDDINTYLAALNAIYEREVATTFILIADNDDLIFFDPATDGLEESNRTGSAQAVISAAIPAANYDIGHVFFEIPGTGTSGSGLAGLGVTCNDFAKAQGWTGVKGNYSVAFFMKILAHEVGHQFSAEHTFYGTSGNCAGFNRSAGSGYEPGSGNSLMSYETICWQTGSCTESHNITPVSSTIYFHAYSVEQITNYINGVSCQVSTPSGNTPPSVTVPSNKTIPKNTPFELVGSATDANGDAIVYHWEEYDTDNLTLSCPNGNPNDAAISTTAPLFRSVDPSSSGNFRSFPKLSDIIGNTQTKGEILPAVARDIQLRLVARDFNVNAGGVDYEEVILTVDGSSGPFEITTANDPNPAYQAGESVTITWDINNTDMAPINCTDVEILFSLDGGVTYPITLANSTPNDGSFTVNMPSNNTAEGRIKIKSIDNYFFDVNNEDITIITDCTIDGGSIINTEMLTADAADPVLDLMLQSGIEVTQISSNLDNMDASAFVTCRNTADNSCTFFGNTPYHETQSVVPNKSGNYTFSRSSAFFSVINIYEEEYDNGNVCLNWLASSAAATGNSISIGNSVTQNLTIGNTYIIKFSAFNGGDTGPYNVFFSNSINGKLFNVEATSPAGYTSSFVVVDDNNTIVGIDSSPDMTNDNIYTGGDYTVYGLSHIISEDLSIYIDGPIAALQTAVFNGTVCADFTDNTKDVTINGCTPGNKTVTSTSDSGPGTLRMLITDACAGDNIVFSNSIPSNTVITLNSEIILNRTVSVDGSAVDNLTISGGATNRIFQIPNPLSLTLSSLSLKDGYSLTNGGAFYNLGEVKLTDIIFENNLNDTDKVSYTGDGSVIIENGEVLIKE